MSSCDTCVVRNRAICSGLDNDEIAALSAIGRRRQLKAGEPLFWEGDESVLVANVLEGVLKLSAGTSDGREQIVGIMYPSDFIGRPFGEIMQHSVTALTDARVCVFPREDFDGFATRHPALEHKLLERTLTELDRTRDWMLLLSRKSAQEKIATFLLEMSQRLSQTTCLTEAVVDGQTFELPFSRQQIGDILGLTIETVSRQLSRLKANGLIELPSRRAVTICNSEALSDLTG